MTPEEIAKFVDAQIATQIRMLADSFGRKLNEKEVRLIEIEHKLKEVEKNSAGDRSHLFVQELEKKIAGRLETNAYIQDRDMQFANYDKRVVEYIDQLLKQRLAERDPQIVSKLRTDYLAEISEVNKALEQKLAAKDARISALERKCADLEAKIGTFQSRNVEKVEKTERPARAEKPVQAAPQAARQDDNNTVGNFNRWAATPGTRLPQAFAYIEGDMKIRTKREVKETADYDAKWIYNRQGAQKYLFPNPNSFDQMTNIEELYTMDMSKLRTKGQNRIKVIEPCEMTDEGWVEFRGKLEILP